MKPTLRPAWFGELAGACALTLVLWLPAPGRGAEAWDDYDPRWFQMDPPKLRVSAEVEALRETIRSSQSGNSVHENITVTPLLGVKLNGFIYHPNLLSFEIDGEGGLGYDSDKVSTDAYTQKRNGRQDLERYDVMLHFLDSKPYHATAFASQDRFYRNYDFFNTATVDTSRYGGRMDWRTRQWDLNTEAGYREEHADALSGTSRYEDFYANFNANHRRARGNTTLTYNFDDVTQVFDAVASRGSTHAVYLSDNETLGSRQQISLGTAVSYSRFDYVLSQTETVSASENVKVHHSDRLDSFVNGDYSHSEQSPASSSIFYGMAGVRYHAPVELHSTLEVHGNYDDYDSATSSGANDRYGLGVREEYLKRLGTWGRLSAGASVIGDHVDRDLTGVILSVPTENYSVYTPGTGPGNNYLKNPNVIAGTLEVRTSTGVLVPQAGNYNVVAHGLQTEIERVPGSLLLTTDGQSVIVSYNYVAPPSSSYESVNGSAQLRLDLYELFGVYLRANWLDNNAPPEALVQNLTDWVVGADVHWRWFRAGAECEDYDSNYSQYQAARFYQAMNFRAGDTLNLGFNFNQTFYRYPELQGGEETQYQFMSHLDSQITPWLNWNAEGGYYLRDYGSVSEDLVAARTGLSATWGKLTMRTGYQYNHQLIDQPLNREERDRNFFYLYARRSF